MKYYWNDKEVSAEEYQEINERWKKRVEEISKSSAEPSEKKSRKQKTPKRTNVEWDSKKYGTGPLLGDY